MQESPFYLDVIQQGKVLGREEGIELGREEGIELGERRGIERGIERGARQTSIESTLDILADRFPSADVNALKDTLEAIDDLDRLKQLNINAYRAESLHAFQQSLNGV